MPSEVQIFKIVLASMFGWPSGHVIVHIAKSFAEAEEYISVYPNIFYRPYLSIVPENIPIPKD